MTKFNELALKGPATLEAVVEAVVCLSARDESEVLALVSRGRLSDAFPFKPRAPIDVVDDYALDEDLVEASAMPLELPARAALIQSSMPSALATGNTSAGSPMVALVSAFMEIRARAPTDESSEESA